MFCQVICGDGRLYVAKLCYASYGNDLDMQHKASVVGVAVPIIDSWICPLGTVFVMDKLEVEATKILANCVNCFPLILKSTFSLLRKLHVAGIVHGDLHPGNVMAVAQCPGPLPTTVEEYAERKYKWYLIDFGNSCEDINNVSHMRDYNTFLSSVDELLH